MQIFRLLTAFLAGCILSSVGFGEEDSGEQPPNLVFVFPDEWRGQALGFLKEDPVITPRLDRFAAQSLVLPQAVSNAPVCSPYRASLMSGKYPVSHGVRSNCNTRGTRMGYELKKSERCWSDILKGRGYSLGYIGKWHLDAPRSPHVKCKNNSEKFAWNEWCSPDRRHGFDFWHAYGTYDWHMKPMYWSTDAPRDGAVFVDQWGPEYETDLAIRYLQNQGGKMRNPDRPFALVVSMNPPHMPFNQYPKKYCDAYKGKTAKDLLVRGNVDLSGKTKMGKYAMKNTPHYFSMITGVDEQFGRILDALEEQGLSRNTIVVFTSDHGDCLGAHGMISKNNPYEESMRVPFLVRWPGRIAARRDDLLFSTPDIYPTLLDLMGFGKEIPEGVEGTSHAALFRTGQGPRPSSQLYFKDAYGAPEVGERGIRTARYTMMIRKTEKKPSKRFLWDRQKDPHQLKNVAEDHPEIMERLTTGELLPWLRRTRDPWRP